MIHENATVPDVSVIVPSCNRSEMLRTCLAALAGQSHSNFEVVVIDDGSTDNTPEMVAELARAHPKLKLISLRNETNLGANPSRNRGITASSGRFVAFIDSDCIAEPQWLESLTSAFTSGRVAAVVGRVEDAPPRNIFDLAALGTHRIPGPKANRLIGGNMCIRRDLLLQYRLDEDRSSQTYRSDGSIDTTVSGRGDEEGLSLSLRAAGYDLLVAPNAVALHVHHYGFRAYFKQAYKSGTSAARLVYKYHLCPRLDLAPWMLAYATLPLSLLDLRLAGVAIAFFAAAVAAIVYNELFRKGKTAGQLLRAFPVLIAYYHVRLAGYLGEAIRLRVSGGSIKRVRLSQMSRTDTTPTTSGTGTIRAIAYRPTSGEPMREITECVVAERKGLALEDRNHGKREVTFLSQEAWIDACRDAGGDIPWTTRRANFLVSRIDLAACIGKAIVIGNVRVWIHGETKPCQLMDDQIPGLRRAMKPGLRGGVHGQITSGGLIRVGDTAKLDPSPPKH